MNSVFPLVLKTANVVPVKNDSKLDFTIFQSPSYQVLNEHLKNLCIKDFTTSSITIVLSLLSYSLVSDKDFSRFHALINITENIRKILDYGDIYCEVVVNLQQTFDTVDYQILSAKLNGYVNCGVFNDWIKS